MAYYTSSDRAGNEAPLTYIDATEPTLRRALGLDADAPRSPMAALLAACGPAEHARRVLAGNEAARAMAGRSRFRYLVLVCALYAEQERPRGRNDLRKNLADAFDGQAIFGDLRGLPRLWEDFRRDCERRRRGADGEAVREVHIARPADGFPHVGTVHQMTFPSWRDGHALLRAIDKERSASGDEARLARLADRVAADAVSPPMRLAAKEFLALHRQAHPGTRFHRFARVVSAAELRACDAEPEQAAALLRLRLTIDDLFGEVTLEPFVERPDGDAEEPEDGDAAPGPLVPTLRAVSRALAAQGSRQPLSRMLAAECLFFEPERLGSMLDCLPSPDDSGTYLVLLGPRAHAAPEARGLSLEPIASGDDDAPWWRTTAAEPAFALRPLLELPALRLAHVARDYGARALRFEGGVRDKSGAYLAHAPLLPRAHAPAGYRLTLRALDEGASSTDAQLRSGEPLALEQNACAEGRYEVIAEPERADESVAAPTARRSIKLRTTALPSAAAQPPARDWRPVPSVIGAPGPARPDLDEPSAETPPRRPTSEGEPLLNALVEAIGFRMSLRAGLSEPLLLDWAAAVLGDQGPHPRDALYQLWSAGVIAPYLAQRWWTRRWYACAPRLVALGADGSGRARFALVGAAGAHERDRLRGIAERLGERVEMLAPISSHALSRLIITVGDPAAFARLAPFEIDPGGLSRPLEAPRCWPAEADSLLGHQRLSAWRFRDGRMINGHDPQGEPVALSVHRRRDSPDLYRVAVPGAREASLLSVSREHALAEAYRLAARPFLVLEDERIRCTTLSGRLPVEMARWLERCAGRAAGPVRVGERWSYAYPASSEGLAWLARCFGLRFVDGLETPRHAYDLPLAQRALLRRGATAGRAAVLLRGDAVHELAKRSSRRRER